MKYEIRLVFILHSSLNFAKQNSFGRAASLRSRRAIRYITRAAFHAVAGGFASIPLAGALRAQVSAASRAGIGGFAASSSKYARIKYLIPEREARYLLPALPKAARLREG